MAVRQYSTEREIMRPEQFLYGGPGHGGQNTVGHGFVHGGHLNSHHPHHGQLVSHGMGETYFDRNDSNDYGELQESKKIIEVSETISNSELTASSQVLYHRVRTLENMNMEIESRLEQQAKVPYLPILSFLLESPLSVVCRISCLPKNFIQTLKAIGN
jgi:hypothetical protein